MSKDKKKGMWFLVLVFFVSLVSMSNIGQQVGIQAPYNIAVYGGGIFFVLFTTFYSLKTLSFHYSHLFPFAVLTVIFLIVTGLLNSSLKDVEYTFYALLVGFLFLVSLVQYQWNKIHWFWFFYAIVILALVQASIALIQRFDTFGIFYWWTGYFPFKFHNGYLGSLQQRNMLASFMAFAVVTSLWLVLQRRFFYQDLIFKFPVFILVFLGVYIIVGSGSRAGLLGLILGFVFLLLALWQNIKVSLRYVVLIILLAVLGGGIALLWPADISSASSKLESVVYGSDVRLFLYETGWQLFLENLWFGVGIGHYPVAFQDYVTTHGLFLDKRIIDFNFKTFKHPHNELLFWLIQTGIVGCLPILIGIGLLLRNWWQQGQKQFWVYIGLCFPLVLQIMVSYPLILSATHYFLMLVLLVFSLKLPVKAVGMHSFKSVVKPIQFMLLVIGFCVLYGVYLGLMSAFEAYYFKNRLFFYKEHPKQEKIGYFQYASNWSIYHELVFKNMENLFLNAKKDNNLYDLNQYLLWYDNQDNKADLPKSINEYAKEAKSFVKTQEVITY
ncbi:hypothetical protein JCM30760_20390 [Thiomicrorhabdus hydrogeniphila]